MLGRRSLRIKVMQTLYGWELDHDIPLSKLRALLQTQTDKAIWLFLTDLCYLVEICLYSKEDKAKRMAKFIKTDDDLRATSTIASNVIIRYLQNHTVFNDLVKKHGIFYNVSREVIKTIYNDLYATGFYKTYAALAEPTLEQDRQVIISLLREVINEHPALEQQLEEIFPNLDDDQPLLLHIISKYVEEFDPEKNNFFSGLELWEEEKKFAFELLDKTVEHHEEFIRLIQPNLQNWDMERVAVLDLILLKMAICELLYFPTVPVKVTINEYIDISKFYSTPRSKDFVNGLLDKIKNQLTEQGAIKKYGRGLL
ncbi:MAG: transcription antitermination factor NusB [Chitinophagales bacterium]|nr:transcription antitermination factor NusB [Chitinophagales bacterium]MDW8419098.1 transcription antitermination factor NusB [Chitinophagales bacterium]